MIFIYKNAELSFVLLRKLHAAYFNLIKSYTKLLHTKKIFFVCDVWNDGFLMINLLDKLQGIFLL